MQTKGREKLRQTRMFLFSRPTNQICRLDAAKPVGVFHLFDKRREETLLSLCVLGFFQHEIAVARLGGPKGNHRLGRIQLFFDFFVPAFTDGGLDIEKDRPALRPQAFRHTLGDNGIGSRITDKDITHF